MPWACPCFRPLLCRHASMPHVHAPPVWPMPGSLMQVWDEDFLGDDLIGKAIIDIEDRWYCPKWYDFQPLDKRPKEYVPLWSPMSGVPQGRLEV